MAKLILNAGTSNNDKTGDTLRAGALKIKSNFDEIYTALANDGMTISGGNLLKTGDYQDLRNKPTFSVVATSGNFYDLSARPDIGIFVGDPGSSVGTDGNVAGNLAFDNNNLYVCRTDYVETEEFTGFNFLRADGDVAYALVARFNNTGAEIAFTPNEGTAPLAPQVDWTVSDGTTTRVITSVSEEVDGATLYYLCTLDGAFNSTAGVSYTISFPLATGQYAFYSSWNGSYQNLIDAHAIGDPIHLFVTYDGYGRLVNHVLRNSQTNELVVTYTAGSEIADYDGITIKIDQPEIWKSVPWAPTFGDPFPGGGAANTGDITFSGVKIIGDGTASGDGFGYSTIELVPDNALYNISPGGDFGSGGQYLVIDPTTPNHIHIRAGGPQDEAAAQLILGGEAANVTVRDQNDFFDEDHHVIINTQNDAGTDLYAWQFKSDGDLELPTNGGIVFDRANTTIRVGMGFHIASGEGISLDAIDETDPDNLVYKNWYFGPDGILIFPNGTTTTGDTVIAPNIYNIQSIGNTLIQTSANASAKTWTFNSDGDLTFPDSTVQSTAWAGGRVVTAPTHSTGASGNLVGDLAFSNGYIYYCTANYVGGSISVTTLASSGTVAWIDSTDYTGNLVADFTADPTGWTYNGVTIVSVTVDNTFGPGYALEGTTGFGTSNGDNFTLVSGADLPDIWKRVAWSNDTW